MEVFVKSFSDYRTIKKATAVSSVLVLDALDPESSSVTVAGTGIDRSDAGNWLIAEGQVFHISHVQPETDHTVITLESPLDAFSRPLELEVQPANQTIGAFVAAQLQTHWVACDDAVYALPYLTVSNSDTTPFVSPETDNANCFSIPAYCRLMRRSYRTAVQFRDAGKTLACEICALPVVYKQISFEDGQSQLQSAAFSSTGLAKITAIQDVDTGEKDASGNSVTRRERTVWYLSASGEVSQLMPANRAAGAWGTVYVSGKSSVLEKVVETFAKNKTGHKVEFWSTRNLDVLTDCAFWINGQLLHSYISYKRKSINDKRFFYKSGELATTATEKLKGVLK